MWQHLSRTGTVVQYIYISDTVLVGHEARQWTEPPVRWVFLDIVKFGLGIILLLSVHSSIHTTDQILMRAHVFFKYLKTHIRSKLHVSDLSCNMHLLAFIETALGSLH